MSRTHAKLAISVALIGLLPAPPAAARNAFLLQHRRSGRKNRDRDPSRSPAEFEIESADDFVLTHATSITSATFTGLLPVGYDRRRRRGRGRDLPRVSAGLGCRPNERAADFSTPHVPTRVNSPSDVAFRQPRLRAGGLSFTTSVHGRRLHRAQLRDARRNPSQTRPYTPAATVRSRARRCSST